MFDAEQTKVLDHIAAKIAKRSGYSLEEARSTVQLVAEEKGHTFRPELGSWWKWASRWIYRHAWRRLCDESSVVHVPWNLYQLGERAYRLDIWKKDEDDCALSVVDAVCGEAANAVESGAEQWSNRRALTRCMGNLTPTQATVIVALYGLYDLPQLSAAELAVKMGVSPSAVRRNACVAMAKIRKRAARLGITEDDFAL